MHINPRRDEIEPWSMYNYGPFSLTRVIWKMIVDGETSKSPWRDDFCIADDRLQYGIIDSNKDRIQLQVHLILNYGRIIGFCTWIKHLNDTRGQHFPLTSKWCKSGRCPPSLPRSGVEIGNIPQCRSWKARGLNKKSEVGLLAFLNGDITNSKAEVRG